MKGFIYIFLCFVPFILNAQLTEDFSDGDFTNNPIWSGTTADFTINVSNQLQTNATVASTSQLTTNNLLTDLNDVEWRFYFKQSFAGSATNYSMIVLTSDTPNLLAMQHGYYVLFGEAGANDAVRLYKVVNGVKTVLLSGTLGAITNSTNTRIKITHNALGEWKLYVDYAGGTNYTLEGTATDTDMVAEPYFGILCAYTVSNIKKIYLDDIYIGAEQVDNTPPTVISTTILNNKTVKVIFDEPIDSAIENQLITTNPTLNLDSISHGNPKEITVYFNTAFANGTTYSATIPSVKDLLGNEAETPFSFTYLVSETPTAGDIIINEVMFDPSPVVGLPEYEFVEIYNRSNKYFNLKGWKLGNNTTFGTINSSVWIAPNEYKVLTSSGGVSSFSDAVSVTSFPTLKNNADDVIILDSLGSQIDKITYNLAWYKDDLKKDGGYTLERINTNLICSDINNWKASVDILGGTPNAVNSVFDNSPDVVAPKIDTIFVLNATTLSVKISETLLSSSISQIVATLTPTLAVSSISQDSTDLSLLTVQLGAPLEINKTYSLKLEALQDCESNSGQSEKNFILKVSETPTAGDIIINEVMFDPSPVVGLPEYEFVEIYNRSNKYFNLKGWKLGNNSTFGTINSSVWIAPNEYKVLTSSGGVSSFSDAVSVTSFPTLKNNADDVIILDSLGNQIDKITYNLTWYKDDEKKDGGYTLERINTNLICSDINNWSASVAILGGTPNAVNSVFDNSPDVVAPKLFAVDVLSDTTLKVIFTEAVLSSNFVFLINPTLTISQITDDTANLAVVYLTLTNKIAPSTSYTLTAQNIEDCEGNLTVEDHVNFVLAHLPQKGEIVFNELLFNPLTGGSDFIELKNITDKTFNLKGLQLTNTKTGTSNNKMLTDNYYLYPQGIVVLTPDTLFLKQNYPFVGSSKFIQTAIPTLNNDVSTIKLFLDSLTTIDSLTYSEKWHFQLLDDYKGKSLERISDNAVSTDASSWHTAAEYTGFATPALENSQNTEYLYNGTLNLSSETLSPDNDGFEDFLTMTYEMDNSGYVGSITIFDDRGREVRKLIQNELLGVRGEFLWDGLNEKLQKANIGTHIIIFSGYHATTGKTFKIKKVVVVASQKH